MTMMRWDPFTEANTLRDVMDRFFGAWDRPRMLYNGSNGDSVRPLPIDMYETSDAFVVKAQIPGVHPDNVNVTVEQGYLTIKCHVPSDVQKEEARTYNWVHREVGYGEYARSINLPGLVDADKVEATFDLGVLTLHIPKAEAAKPKQIKVKVGAQ